MFVAIFVRRLTRLRGGFTRPTGSLRSTPSYRSHVRVTSPLDAGDHRAVDIPLRGRTRDTTGRVRPQRPDGALDDTTDIAREVAFSSENIRVSQVNDWCRADCYIRRFCAPGHASRAVRAVHLSHRPCNAGASAHMAERRIVQRLRARPARSPRLLVHRRSVLDDVAPVGVEVRRCILPFPVPLA